MKKTIGKSRKTTVFINILKSQLKCHELNGFPMNFPGSADPGMAFPAFFVFCVPIVIFQTVAAVIDLVALVGLVVFLLACSI